MTQKDRTIKAIEFLIEERYSEGKSVDCPLCKIYNKSPNHPHFSNCDGCLNMIFAKEKGNVGCSERLTFSEYEDGNSEVSILNEANAEFWTKALPRLRKIKTEYFTKTGFSKKPFEFMKKIDEEMTEKYNLL